MGTEIERKFLVEEGDWRRTADGGTLMAQGYLVGDATCSVRVRLAGDRAWLTIKGPTVGISRLEFEYPVPPADASVILESLCGGRSVSKTRYRVPHDGRTWEVDEFHGANLGLVVAEIELQSENEEVVLPEWLGQEVSGDPRYMNATLASHPWGQWGRRQDSDSA